jgi:hypothetical protein
MTSLLQDSANVFIARNGTPMFGTSFAISLAFDLLCVALLTGGIYYRHYRRSDLFLTFFSFNLVIFLIGYSLSRVQLSMGAAFGLFAVFSMLRYRTEDISAKDMTYMFLVIALGLLMALSGGQPSELAAIGAVVLLPPLVLEGSWLVRREFTQEVWYDRIELVAAGSRGALLEDLRTRTGLDIHRVEVKQIDFLRDAARLTLYHHTA